MKNQCDQNLRAVPLDCAGKPIMYRIPRKIKKKYKKIWEKRSQERLIIRRSSVRKDYGECSRVEMGYYTPYRKVWGCEVYPRKAR